MIHTIDNSAAIIRLLSGTAKPTSILKIELYEVCWAVAGLPDCPSETGGCLGMAEIRLSF